ncbi:hypothetical protein CU098_007486 [Rhizopus stolonifer]|uniref:TEX10-like TPR repeats domain-containing protein n=1 Tax=Rhizopus stolonifer TaxID=4846 RepID=A0A367J4V8_RHIST|nr:hypothetical protein CU098_007486 [Rhizopus stolonifer]
MRQYTTANDTMVQWDPKKHNAYMPTHAMVHAVLPSSATFSHLHLFDTSGPKSNGQPNTLETQTEFSLEERLGHIKELIETFQPRLVAAWLEAAPSVFMSTSSIAITPALELLHEILTLSLVLWRAMVGSDIIRLVSQDWLNMYLQQLLKHLTVYFPYGADALGNRGSKVDDKLQEMNIMLCELTSLFLLARTILQPSATEEPRQKRRKLESEDQVPSWAETVVQYVLGVLGYHEDQDGMTSASSSFRTDHLVSLLPAIWGFLNCLTNEESVTLFKATVQYYHTCQPNAASRKVLLDFITRAYMVQSTPSYHGQFMITKDSELARLLKEWLLGLPKMLWQLRANHIETSRAILNVMCDIAKRADKDVFDFDTLRQVETTLVPFFFVQLAKGPLFGPFRDLPADVQQRALDYVNYLGSPSEKMSLAIQQCKK